MISLPLQLVEGLRKIIATQRLAADQPLWLDLVRPYGLLGVLPWEAALGAALGRPILRLPSFVEPPQEDQDIADVAMLLCADPTNDCDRTVWQVRNGANAILQDPNVSRLACTFLRRSPGTTFSISQPLADEQIRLYRPRFRAEKTRPTDLRRLWTDWISVSLGGQTLDAVHLICDTEPTAQAPCLVSCSLGDARPQYGVPSLG